MYNNYHDKVNKFGITLDRILKLYTTFRLLDEKPRVQIYSLRNNGSNKTFLIIMTILLRILAQVKRIIYMDPFQRKTAIFQNTKLN